MKRIAVVGGGIAGLAAAYELARQQRDGADIAFHLFEASPRVGGTVLTEERDGFVVECGPDSWVSEKPWARELACELGLESDLIFSCDAERKTWIAEKDGLRELPPGLRMMVPTDLNALDASPLFSAEMRAAFRREMVRAEALRAIAPEQDESIRAFVERHFGEDVATRLAAPLLAGVFGGDIDTLSVCAILPEFVAMEREHGSLILGLQERLRRRSAPPVFTTLRSGLSTLVQRIETVLPLHTVQRNRAVEAIEPSAEGWRLRGTTLRNLPPIDGVLLATPADATRSLLQPLEPKTAQWLPQQSSSAVVVALAFAAGQARSMALPQGFGFLVPRRNEEAALAFGLDAQVGRSLLACTFVHQKFPDRVPPGAALLRVFLGGPHAGALLLEKDAALAKSTYAALGEILGPLPAPQFSVVHRWPQSLPLYPVGHVENMAALDRWAATLPGLRLLGNAYRGVGLPDLIRYARRAARELAAE